MTHDLECPLGRGQLVKDMLPTGLSYSNGTQFSMIWSLAYVDSKQAFLFEIGTDLQILGQLLNF